MNNKNRKVENRDNMRCKFCNRYLWQGKNWTEKAKQHRQYRCVPACKESQVADVLRQAEKLGLVLTKKNKPPVEDSVKEQMAKALQPFADLAVTVESLRLPAEITCAWKLSAGSLLVALVALRKYQEEKKR